MPDHLGFATEEEINQYIKTWKIDFEEKIKNYSEELKQEYRQLSSIPRIPVQGKDLTDILRRLLLKYTKEEISKKIDKPIEWINMMLEGYPE